MTEHQKITAVRAINHFGVDCQVDKALEEMGELIVELARRKSPRHDREKVAEEIADALIMLEQLRIIYGGERVDWYVQKKLERLDGTMNGDWRRQEAGCSVYRAAAQSFDTGHSCGSRGQKNETDGVNS